MPTRKARTYRSTKYPGIDSYELATGARRYRVRFRTPNRRSTDKSGFRTLDEARNWQSSLNVSKLEGTYVDAAKARVSVGDWAEQWFGGKANLAKTTRDRYRNALDTHILPRWGNTRLADVTHGDIQTWITDLSVKGRTDALSRRQKKKGRGSPPKKTATGGLSAASVVKAHRVLSMVLQHAVKDGRLPKNPATGADLPRVESAEKRYLSAEQVDALAAKSGTGGGVLVYMLAYTGLRWGELAALKVNRLDLLRRRVHVAENVVELNDGTLEWKLPKDHERRWVPLPRFLADELERHIKGKKSDALVFPGRGGVVLRNGNARRAWFDAGVAASGAPDGFTPHELRHTAASLAVSAGANVKAVQRMLGHAKASMTLDVYADLFDDDLEAVAERLDEIATRARNGPTSHAV